VYFLHFALARLPFARG